MKYSEHLDALANLGYKNMKFIKDASTNGTCTEVLFSVIDDKDSTVSKFLLKHNILFGAFTDDRHEIIVSRKKGDFRAIFISDRALVRTFDHLESLYEKRIQAYCDRKLSIKLNERLKKACFGVALEFMLLHAIGHFLHYSVLNEDFFAEERVDKSSDSGKSLISHAMEVDADRFAARFVADRIIYTWAEFFINPVGTLEGYTVLCLCLIFEFFCHLGRNKGHLGSYLDTSHPNPVDRCVLIALELTHCINENLAEGNDDELYDFNGLSAIHTISTFLTAPITQIEGSLEMITDSHRDHFRELQNVLQAADWTICKEPFHLELFFDESNS